MKRKIGFAILVLSLCFALLTSCATENLLDESDNNVGRITIENLASAYLDNPCVFESEAYLNGKLNIYEKWVFGKNAIQIFQKQSNPRFEEGFQIMMNAIISRRENNFAYFYHGESFVAEESNISKKEYDFDKENVNRKRSKVSGLLFEDCHKYFVQKGKGIYQVNPDVYTEYGTLAAESYDARGVEFIIQNAKTLKVVINEDNSVELSYLNMVSEKTLIRIYGIGKNYVTPPALKERIDAMIENGEKTCNWEMPT